METKLYFILLFTPFNSVLTITAVLILGVLSGAIPALMISRFNPVDIVKGSFRKQNKLMFSKLFIIIQNVITIVLIVAAVVMWNQTQHLITAPLGYNADNKITMDTEIDKSLLDNFVSEVRQLACVKQIGFSQGTPFSCGNNNTASADGRTISFQIITADSAFINMYDLKILNNNHSDQAGAVFLSEQAMKELEIDANVTEFKFGNYARPVAGSIKDFRLHNVMRPFDATLVCIQKTPFYPWHTTIEIQGDNDLAFQQVASVYKKVTGIDFAGKYVDQEIAKSFAAQNRMSKIVLLFSAIAVLISLMGLLAMSTYFIQQQSKNIALRKVMGATNTEVLVLLVGTFLIYVGVAFVVATPIAWYVMRNWLSDYSYRIELTPSLLVSGGLFCFVVSFVTVYWQSWCAAIANPVERIKSE